MDPISSTTNSTAGTGSSIISALGSGSGINTTALVDSLVSVSKLADTNRLTTKTTLLKTQISDFGLLRSAFSKLEAAASILGNEDTFNAKSVSVPTTTLLGITKLDAKAVAGDYSIKVDAIAQAQSLSSGNFGSQTAAIGKGTLAIRFGTWSNELVPPGSLALDTFTVDATKTGGTITIDDSNNSLTGLRDAINKSGIGVKASIVSNAGVFKLVVTGPSGATNEVEITATEVGGPGLSSFNLNNTTQNLTQVQEGKDSVVRVNGMEITRSSNHLTDVVEGLEFDIFNSSLAETVNISISDDKAVSEKSIRDFVAAYNTFLEESGKLIGFDTEKEAFGSLHQDPLAKNLLQQVRNQLGASVTGVTSAFTSLASLGIRTELDGTLKIDDSTAPTSFRSAIDKNFTAVRDLFIPKTSSDNAQIVVTKQSAKSVAGSYEVVITQQPAKGQLIAGVMGTTFPLDTTGKTYTFTAAVDGISASAITLPVANYLTGDALAADLQTRINSDANLVAAKVSLAVSYNSGTNKLEFTSNAYGSSSNVAFSAVTADMADMGISDSTGTAGANVGGTVGGVTAFGLGNVLLPALGSKAEGLSMHVEPGATTGTITFARGFAGSFTRLIDDFLKNNGMIKNRETNITKEVEKAKTDQKTLDRRSQAYRARLQAQFSAMESIVRGLKSTGTFLTGAFKALSGDTSN
ncbi:MAG: flagellar filament capping protein FliD [Pseudomonadota bacterium]